MPLKKKNTALLLVGSALLITTPPSFAACTNHTPGTGQTVICSADPSAVTTPISAAPGSSNVTVTIANGASLTTGGNTIQVQSASRVENFGDIRSTAGPAVRLDGNPGSTLINNGNINAGSGVAVQSGSGNDRFEMLGGTVTGAVNQGLGDDTLIVTGGTITGAVNQGDGSNDFIMHNGQIASLDQSDSHDTFAMTGGRIVGAFENGDTARMSGGRIGRVNMRLDDNLFDMSGGQIDGNLVTGFGNDTILLSAGDIGGNISISDGNDSVTVSGGQVGAEVRLGGGNDRFTWMDGGRLEGAVLLADGNDQAVLRNLNEALLAPTPLLDGGLGSDNLTFDNSQSARPGRYRQFENIALANGSSLTLDQDLLLGDSASLTGTLTLDAGSRLLASGQGSRAIGGFDGSAPVSVVNAGTFDLSDGAADANDRLTIHGNYQGQGARLRLQSILGSDDSPSDRLIVDGTASGDSQIQLSNLNGAGAATTGNGILLVQSGTSTPGAFSLAGGSIAAGAYEYVLFHGGVTPGAEHNWYLRNSLIAPPAVQSTAITPPTPTPSPGTPPLPTPTPAPGTPTPPTPGGSNPPPALPLPTPAPGSPALPEVHAGQAPAPLYRQEVPPVSVAAPLALQLGLDTIATFHQRQGDQALLDERGGWARAYGEHREQDWAGTVAPSFDGSLSGVQLGQDLFVGEGDDGQRDHAGLFIGYSRADGDVDGTVLAQRNAEAGDIEFDGYSLGLYWTHVWSGEAYVDAVLTHTWLNGESRSERGRQADLDGRLFSASLEAGYPIALGANLSLEPQAQVVGQRLSMDNSTDAIASLRFEDQEQVSGRLGVRLQGQLVNGEQRWQPYLQADVWHDFAQTATLHVASTPISTDLQGSSLNLGAGLNGQLSANFGVYLGVENSRNLDSNARDGWAGNLGARLAW
ncbi:autotransporter outer membrane beta-barrel domain-containing protein [Pseudomonas sp. LS44]|uniref:autotransporter family protein n=1 Tax=Pseudomonas sp. LS44 TaxID=1357074 RepID=UPI00215A30CE|nr:autotransporter outer membrane beta-barrel domain-containing protein [Pseudomonas sp. LS44]UVE18434.1 autotransporter outer membrane beta-barrel domain-containing protein [Pseudomonas sp. LS44]